MGAEIAAVRAAAGDEFGYGIPTHVTLLPPTTVTAEQRVQFVQHLHAVTSAHRAFTVQLAGTGTFRPTSDVVFLALADGDDQCRSLADDVCAGPVPSPSPFAYHPHVTLAHGIAPPLLDQVHSAQRGFAASFRVDDVCLYEMSESQVWRLHSRFPLGG